MCYVSDQSKLCFIGKKFSYMCTKNILFLFVVGTLLFLQVTGHVYLVLVFFGFGEKCSWWLNENTKGVRLFFVFDLHGLAGEYLSLCWGKCLCLTQKEGSCVAISWRQWKSDLALQLQLLSAGTQTFCEWEGIYIGRSFENFG